MPEDLTTRDLLRALLSSQLESNRRQAALEEVVLKLSSLSTQESTRASSVDRSSTSPGIDLARFCMSDGPVFKGPYQDIKSFLCWVTSLKAFFRTKGVTLDSDQITLVGNFIDKPTTQAFYEGTYDELSRGTWDNFVVQLFKTALPVKWEDKLYEKIQYIRMSPFEDFKSYSTRA